MKHFDAPPSSFMDSTVSPKVKTIKEKGNGAHFLSRNTSRVEGRAGISGLGLGRLTSKSITHTDLHKPTSWLVHSWSIFGAQTNHGQTWTHKTHHGPDLGEATTFLLIVYYVRGQRTSTQMSFCPRIPKLGVLRFSKLRLLQLWKPITFFCKPCIEVKSKAKLQPFLRTL